MRRDSVVPTLRCLALGAAGVLAGGSAALDAAGRGPLPDDATVVDVRLSTPSQLPATARATVIAEADAIWQQAGVRLRWDPAEDADPPADAALRVLVVANDSTPVDGVREWHVGRLLIDQDDRFVAVVSLGAAERTLDSLLAFTEPLRLRERRLGLILGRTVAHELGHFLLDSATHGQRGLMRAAIKAGDLADLRSGGFILDAAATAWIRARSAKTADDDHGQRRRFDYAP